MSYRLKTPYLGIPVPRKEKLRSDVEWRKAIILENMLIAGTQGVRFVIFDDGDYVINNVTDGTRMVTLSAIGKKPAAHGIIGGAYFHVESRITWLRLRKGDGHVLYLKGEAKTFEDRSRVRAISSLYPLEGAHLLMAYVNREGQLDPNPDGKIYSKDITLHASDSRNPHGCELQQDTLIVGKELILRGGLSIESGEKLLSITGASLVEMTKRQIEIVDFNSFGQQGGLKSVDSRIVRFVQVQRRVEDGMQGTLGEVAVGYHGQDPQVDMFSEFRVYNSGDEGIPLRALVLCG